MAVLKRAGEKPSKTSLQARIEEIKFLLEGELIGEHREDVTAVLEGYESGSLEYIPWHYYVFKEGKKVAGPRPMEDYDRFQVLFEEFRGAKLAWIEEVSVLEI